MSSVLRGAPASKPVSSMRARNAGSDSTLSVASRTRAWAAAGTAGVVHRPIQASASSCGNPASPKVGTSGSCGTRLGELTAKALILPDLIRGSEVARPSNISGTWLPMTSASAGVDPL